MGSIGFKEWALVCEALGRGEQSILIRKGGIAEGREGFAFKHPDLFLFPTFFHEQLEKVRGENAELPARREGEVEIRYFAQVDVTHVITSWETTAALEPLHILQPAVMRERFVYDNAPGIHIAFVRVFRLQPSWVLADEKRYGGCRSWVDLPESGPLLVRQPVISDAAHARSASGFRDIINASARRR